MIVDALDEDIVRELAREKSSLKELSKKLGIPLSTLHSRIKRLEKEGIIKRYRAEVAWERLGYTITAYVLIYVDTTKLKELRISQEKIREKIKKFPFVEECRIIAGEADLIAKIRARTTSELGKFLTSYIQQIKGVVKTKSIICLD